jgi:hypothetical protein
MHKKLSEFANEFLFYFILLINLIWSLYYNKVVNLIKLLLRRISDIF